MVELVLLDVDFVFLIFFTGASGWRDSEFTWRGGVS